MGRGEGEPGPAVRRVVRSRWGERKEREEKEKEEKKTTLDCNFKRTD